MDYHLKYLKYKNKYINLKNMIGNGKTPQSQEQIKQEKIKKELIDYLEKERITDVVIYAISTLNEKHKIDKAKAKDLLNELNAFYYDEVRSNLLYNLLLFDISAKEINRIINYLFKKNYDLLKKNNKFGIKNHSERYEKIIYLFIFNLNDAYNSKTTDETNINIIHGYQLKTLSQFTKIQFYLLKKIISKEEYRDILIIEPIIEIINTIIIPDDINKLVQSSDNINKFVQSSIDIKTQQLIEEALKEKLNELIGKAEEKRKEILK